MAMVKNDLTTYGVGIGLLNPEALIPRTGSGAAIDGGAAAAGDWGGSFQRI